MAIEYETIVKGNSLRTREGFLALANLTLIFSPEDLVLFDTGHYSNRSELVAGLGRLGLAPADVGKVFLSHLHFDHSHNIDLFPDAQIYVSKLEWDYARQPHKKDIHIPWLIHEQLQKHDLRLVEGEGQLVDGVRYLAAPGHTPGSYVLEFENDTKGTVVAAGDALKTLKESTMRQSTMSFGRPEDSAKTIDRILSRADCVIPGHSPELIRKDGIFVAEEDAEITLIIR